MRINIEAQSCQEKDEMLGIQIKILMVTQNDYISVMSVEVKIMS